MLFNFIFEVPLPFCKKEILTWIKFDRSGQEFLSLAAIVRLHIDKLALGKQGCHHIVRLDKTMILFSKITLMRLHYVEIDRYLC